MPDAGRSDRKGRGSLRSSAQVCDRFVRLAQRVRLLIGISTTANRGPKFAERGTTGRQQDFVPG